MVDSARKSPIPNSPEIQTHGALVAFRLIAVLVAIVAVTAVARLMESLSWEMDGVIAAILVIGWAYRFEQGERGR